jgi:hypothetical protein
MKKLLSMILMVLFFGVVTFPAITAGNLTTVGGGWYSFAYSTGCKYVVLMVDYTKGNETDLRVEIGYSFKPWTNKTAMLSDRSSANAFGKILLIMPVTAVTIIPVEPIQATGTVSFHIYTTGATMTGTAALGAEAKY